MRYIFTALFFLLVVFPNPTTAQGITPSMQKIGGTMNEDIWRISKASDGGFIGIGSITPAGAELTERDLLITQFDATGSFTDSWEIDVPARGSTRTAISLDDGSIVLLFVHLPHDNLVDNTVVCRVSASGALLWAKQFGDEEDELVGGNMILDEQGNLVVAGHLIPTGSSNTGNEKGVLIKMTVDGSVLFRKQWDPSPDWDQFQNLTAVEDGYLVSGYSDFLDPDDSPVTTTLSKFDFNGTLVWSNAYSDGSKVRTNDTNVLEDEEGNIYLIYGVRGFDSTDFEEQDIAVLKLDATGGIIWANRYGQSGGGDDIDFARFGHDGTILINGDLPDLGFGGTEAMVMEIDASGSLLRTNLFGGTENDFINDLIPITDEGCGGYLLAGASASFNLDGSNDVWVMKVDHELGGFNGCFTPQVPIVTQGMNMQISSLGAVSDWNITSDPPSLTINTNLGLSAVTVPGCTPVESSVCAPSSTVGRWTPSLIVEVYPNPVSNELFFAGSLEDVEEIIVLDVTGRIVQRNKNRGNRISTAGLSTGIYQLGFLDEVGRLLGISRVVKQ